MRLRFSRPAAAGLMLALAMAFPGGSWAQAATPAPMPAGAASAASRALAAAAGAPGVATAASAAPASAGALDLLSAYRLAQVQDATLAVTRAAADARREREPQARAQLLPNLSLSSSRLSNHLLSTQPGLTGPVSGDLHYHSRNDTLSLRQPLYRPYQYADLNQAIAQVADANAQLEKEKQNLAVRVAGAYLDVLLGQDQLDLVLTQKGSYAAQLDAARKRFAAGAGVRTDIDEAQAKYDMTVAQELEARQNISYTRRALQVLVNQPVAQVAPIDPARLPLVPPQEGLAGWLDKAEASSPEIASLRAQVEAARQDVEKARAGHKPTLDAIAQWSISDSDTVTTVHSHYNNKAIGVQLSVPLYAGGQVNSQVRQALASLEQAEQQLEATRRDLALRIEKEYRGVTEGQAKVAALEKAARSAEIMVVSNRRSYEGGARTLLDILNAEEQKATALRDLANARYQYVMSRVRLEALVGEANETLVAKLNTWLAR